MMKKLLIVVALFSFILGTGDVWAGAKGTGKAGDYLGQGKLDSDPQRTFRLVRFQQGNGQFVDCEISKDSIVVWNLTADDGVTVSLTQTSNAPFVAGILATTCDSETTATLTNTAAQDIGRDNWAWMQVYGLCDFIGDGAAAFSAGDAIGTGTKFGKVGRYTASTSAGSTNGFAGFSYDAAGATSTFEGFIRTE